MMRTKLAGLILLAAVALGTLAAAQSVPPYPAPQNTQWRFEPVYGVWYLVQDHPGTHVTDASGRVMQIP